LLAGKTPLAGRDDTELPILRLVAAVNNAGAVWDRRVRDAAGERESSKNKNRKPPAMAAE
jgi:hypothetical protein